jgi:uncharacterized protein YhaN
VTRRQQAVAFFAQQGWTLAQAAGIVANLEAESGLRPDAVGDSGLAYGIAQWHPDRQAYFAGVAGKPIQGSTLEEQLSFVHTELRSTEKKAGERLAACKTAGEAGACVSTYYERPADTAGEASKRAAIAERIFAENTQPAAPIEDHSEELQPMENDMGAGLLMGLVQSLIAGFAPVAKQQITQAMDKHGQDSTAMNTIMDAVLNAVSTATGTSVATMKADDKAAIAAVNTVQSNAAMQAQVEADSLAHLDKMMDVLNKLHALSVQDRQMDETSMNNAQARGDSSKFDARPQVAAMIFWGTGLLVFAEVVIALAYIVNGKPVPDLFIGLFITTATWVMAKGSTLVDYAFGTSKSSTDKDVTIANAMAKK